MAGDAAYGMTEPFDQGRRTRRRSVFSRSPSPDACGLLQDLHGDYRSLRLHRWANRGDRREEIPEFAPAAKFAGNPRGLAGARLVSLAGGRPIHFVAETILRRARMDDEVTIFAYSLDHPWFVSAITAAVQRGVRVAIYMDYKYLLGENQSKHGTRLLVNALGSCARARGRGSLRLFSQIGRNIQPIYDKYNRSISQSAFGSLHAKVLYAYPYLLVGSANWSISSEANKELSLILEIQDGATRSYVEQQLYEMTAAATECSHGALQRSLDAGPNHRARSRGRTAG